jgi:class 3 adenylate cyclase
MIAASDTSSGCGHSEGLVGDRRVPPRRNQFGLACAWVAFGLGTALTVVALHGLSPVGMLAVEFGAATTVLLPLAAVGKIEGFLAGHRHHRMPDRVLATVLFTDIVGSTRHAAELGDRSWRELLDRHDEIARAEIARFCGRVVKNTGDGFLAAFDGPTRAVRCATTLTECMSELGINVRCGMHTGECEIRGDDIGGIAIHMGARIAAQAHAGEVLVSSTVKDLVIGSGIVFQDRGTHALKDVPGEWRLFTPTGAAS